MDFSGDFIWNSTPEVGNLTEVQGQIPYSPQLSIAGLKIDRYTTL